MIKPLFASKREFCSRFGSHGQQLLLTVGFSSPDCPPKPGMSRAKPLPSWTNLTTVSMPGLMTEPVTKWIVLIENQGGFDVDVSRALDAGVDLPSTTLTVPSKMLPTMLSWRQTPPSLMGGQGLAGAIARQEARPPNFLRLPQRAGEVVLLKLPL